MLEFLNNQTHVHAEFAVIWLHGLGADGHDFESISDELELPPSIGVRFIFPHAPIQPVGINGDMRMRAWYDITETDLGRSVDQQGIIQSANQIQEILTLLENQGIARKKIFVAGFSQGGAVALHLAQIESIAGVLILSSYGPTLAQAQALQTKHIWMGHGDYDPVVPVRLAESACQELARLGCSIKLNRYPMPHSVCAPELRDISNWLSNRMEEGR